MADVTPILINQLASQTTLSDSDYFIVGGADAKKITVAQMKEALGINELNNNFQNQIGKVYTQQEILTNALWIEPTQPNHEKNCYMYRVFNEETTNMPPGVTAGVRQPAYIFDQWNACVIVVEIYPSYGHIWINHYNGSQWDGWKNITPQ